MSEDAEITELHAAIFEAWNRRDAAGLAGVFLEDGLMIGFDGSTLSGRAEIERHLTEIFRQHETPPMVRKIRSARFPAPEMAVLHLVAGIVMPLVGDINPNLNLVQVMTAVKRDGGWRVAVLQSTPAALHMDPTGRAALAAELRTVLQNSWRK
jgi:uncharacterized protein (TIGR02246 family)